MNKKLILLALCGAAAMGGGLLLVDHVVANRSQVAKVATAGVAQQPGATLTALQRKLCGQPAPGAREVHSRLAATEVFPGVSTDSADWFSNPPESLTVAPYPDLPMVFYRTKLKTDGQHVTWIGRNPEFPGASFVTIATANGYDAVLLVPGASQFNFHVRNGRALVEEVFASGSDCAVGFLAEAKSAAVQSSGVHYAEAAADSVSSNVVLSGEPRAVGTPLNVDVLFLYNPRAFAVAQSRSSDPVGYIDGYIRASVETINLVLQQSRVDAFVWRYVGLVASPDYPEKVTTPEDLEVISPGGPLDAFTKAARAQYGADQILLWTGDGPRKGVAYAGNERQQPAAAEFTLAALRLSAPVLILAHELSHNFGCHHDRGHAGTGDGSTAQPDGDGFYCYGLLWNDPGATTTSGTVMAYADFLVPYFSNPNITLNVTSALEGRSGPVRDLGTKTIGFAETDPKAAYNGRILQDNAAYMSRVSAEIEAMPEILQQPADATVTAGQSLTLSVSATGGNLTYQWSKAGADIEGATAATFSKTVATGDAGGYSVRVRNSRGSVASRTATVALAASAPTSTPTPTPTPAAAGGSGGGGGAPSIGFYLALLLAALVRFGRSRLAAR